MIYNIFKAHLVEKNGLYYIRKRVLFGWLYLDALLGRTTKEDIGKYMSEKYHQYPSLISKFVITKLTGKGGRRCLVLTVDLWSNPANPQYKAFEDKEMAEIRLQIYKIKTKSLM